MKGAHRAECRRFVRNAAVASILAGILLLVLSVHSQSGFQVGYAVITADQDNRPPVAAALFSFRNAQGILVAEAGIQAQEPICRGRIFVDQEGTRTGLALANSGDQAVSAALILRSAAGLEVDRNQLSLGPREHQASFVDELFPTIPEEFTGSLTFETEAEQQRLAAVTLRQSRNVHGERLLATLPVADLSGSRGVSITTIGPESVVFPHIGAGASGSVVLSTQIILVNPGSETLSGTIRLTASDGTPLRGELEGTVGSEFAFELEPNGTFRNTLTSSEALATGYAVVTLEQGSVLPAGTAIFQFREGGGALVSEAGVGATLPTTRARIFVDSVGTRTGLALASPGNDAGRVSFELLDRHGFSIDSDDREIPAAGHLARFADELFSLPPDFTGLLEITSEIPIVPVSLKLTTNERRDFILTTFPIADLTRPGGTVPLVLPQIGFGPGFSTRLILIGREMEHDSLGSISFVQSDGTELVVPLLGQMDSDFPYLINAGGARQLRPGNTAMVAEILLDRLEVIVNTGNTVRIRPRTVDTEGEVRDDFDPTYTSLDAGIATVDELGAVTGMQEGFSTLTVSAGGVLRTLTITVVRVTSGVPGFEVIGVAQDRARRLYLANRQDHTILLAREVEAPPDVYAGRSGAPGYRDAQRLQALFRNPAFLAFNQATGSLYVSDGSNHVIRLVGPGLAGRVETLAGTGQAGSTDGSIDLATFNDPQGIALDDRGGLWLADSANHAIRRIDLVAGTVETVAGQAGSAGFVDGTGAEARFNSPRGIGIQGESLAHRLERESRPDSPPPPVSVIVADTGNGVIRRVTLDGEVETIGASDQQPSGVMGTPGYGARSLVFDSPTGVAVDPFGNIYVTEPDSGEILTILSTGEVVAARQRNRLSRPQGLVVAEGGSVVVADAQLSAQRIVHGRPEITSVTPPVTSSRGGDAITIRGRNFAPDSLVVVSGVVIEEALVEDTQTITFRVPPLASGRTFVTVQNRGGLVQATLLLDAIRLSDLPEGSITTVAGGATFAGEGRNATAAVLNGPVGLALDGIGNLFIADQLQNRVRRVDAATGIITTVAGSGDSGYSGDGGPATAAALNRPLGLAIDGAGNLFIADSGNNRVRRLEVATGVITTVAGSGQHAFSGDGGPATLAGLISPGGLAVDEFGNLFVVDRGNNRIRRVDASTGEITTWAGSGETGFSGDGDAAAEAALADPRGVAVDRTGNLFISDTGNNRIRKVDLTTGTITTVVGNGERDFSGDGGPADEAALADPWGIAVDRAGNLFIVDANNLRVRSVDLASGIIRTVAGRGVFGSSGDGGPALGGSFERPRGVTVDGAGNLFVSDSSTNRVRKVDAATDLLALVAGTGETGFSGDGDPAGEARLSFPSGVAVGRDGHLFIADTNNNRVHEVDVAAGIITTVVGTGACCFGGDEQPAIEATLAFPKGLATDGEGNLFIADSLTGRIRMVEADSGIVTTVAGTGELGFSGDGRAATEASLSRPSGLTVYEADNLFIADTGNDRIRKVDLATGIITTVAGSENGPDVPNEGGLATAAALNRPQGVTVDRLGNLFIADTHSHRIRRVDLETGIIDTVVGTGELGSSGDGGAAVEATLAFPSAVAIDEAGNLFIADELTNRVRMVDAATGTIVTVAGSQEMGFSGDGGPATEAALAFPSGVAVDADGNLFIADSFNSRIRGVRGPPR